MRLISGDKIIIDLDACDESEVRMLILYLMDSGLEWSLEDWRSRGDDIR